jgi:hypothetical protein
VGDLRFLVLLVVVLAPELLSTTPNESASGALAEMGTTRIRDSGTSSKPGTWEMKLFKACR